MKIADVQELMKQLYFVKDEKRGLEKTMLWLVSEIGELSELIAKNSNPQSHFRLQLTHELADCFAWLVSVANLLNIDLEEAVKQKYPSMCPKCHENPCQCLEK